MKNLLLHPLFWLSAFATIFLLTQDYLFPLIQPKTAWLGLPNWLFYLIAIHILFISTFYLFTKKYWK